MDTTTHDKRDLFRSMLRTRNMGSGAYQRASPPVSPPPSMKHPPSNDLSSLFQTVAEGPTRAQPAPPQVQSIRPREVSFRAGASVPQQRGVEQMVLPTIVVFAASFVLAVLVRPGWMYVEEDGQFVFSGRRAAMWSIFWTLAYIGVVVFSRRGQAGGG